MRRRPRIGIVTPSYGNPWREEDLLCRRFAGVVACVADVEILLAAAGAKETYVDGGLAIRRFPATSDDPARRSLLLSALGILDRRAIRESDEPAISWTLPSVLERELLATRGGESDELFTFLRKPPFDAVVFLGARVPSTYSGMRALPRELPAALLAAVENDGEPWLRPYDEVLLRSHAILTVTGTESRLIESHLPEGLRERVSRIGFALRPPESLANRESLGSPNMLLVVRPPGHLRDAEAAEQLERLRHDVRDWAIVESDRGRQSPHKTADADDTWWSFLRAATAVWLPGRRTLFAREVLEAMLSGRPVIVPDDSGPAREHAEAGDGGIWYRDYPELRECLRTLGRREVREALGSQGKEYAERSYGDPDLFRRRVIGALQL